MQSTDPLNLFLGKELVRDFTIPLDTKVQTRSICLDPVATDVRIHVEPDGYIVIPIVGDPIPIKPGSPNDFSFWKIYSRPFKLQGMSEGQVATITVSKKPCGNQASSFSPRYSSP